MYYLDRANFGEIINADSEAMGVEDSHSRLWVWQYNSEIGDFELDYLTRVNVDWGYRSESGPAIICL